MSTDHSVCNSNTHCRRCKTPVAARSLSSQESTNRASLCPRSKSSKNGDNKVGHCAPFSSPSDPAPIDEKDGTVPLSGKPYFACVVTKSQVQPPFQVVRTVKVSNVSLSASEQDVKEFFSFSGDIEYVEMRSGDEWSQIAYVTFKDSEGAETALLLSGATIVDLSVIITPAPDYQLPPIASAPPLSKDAKAPSGSGSAVQKAEDVVTSMLAKGFILGKDAVNKAKSFDEKHQLTSTAGAKVVSFDKKIGLSEKISMGTSAVNEKVKGMDQKFQVSEKTKSAFAAAEQKVSSAGSAIMKNRYVFTGASWVTGAFNKVAKAASDVGSKTKEKVVEQEQKKGLEGEFAQVPLSETAKSASSEHSPKPAPAQGLIL